MSISDLRKSLVETAVFQDKIDYLVRSAIYTEFPLISRADEPRKHDWKNLLLCGSLLARSENSSEQRVALRIADTCLQQVETSSEEKKAAALILHTMANLRTIKLARERNFLTEDLYKGLSLPLRSDYSRREREDSITTSNAKQAFHVNRFQRDFWKAIQGSDWISASAPTSAGKSFLLRSWIEGFFSEKKSAKVVYIVPTRALIQEVTDDFNGLMESERLPNISLHNLPLESNIGNDGGHLFIFTQERLHILLGRIKEITFDAIIIDEAQKIGDGPRGVLLEQVVGESVRRNHSTKVIFASPHVANPSYFLKDSPAGALKTAVDRSVCTVSQNLLFVSQVKGRPMTWNIDYRDGDKELPLGTVNLAFRAMTESKRFSCVAFTMRGSGGNLLYANGQSDAEKYALHLRDAIRSSTSENFQPDIRILSLIALIQKTVHKDYSLIETLRYGIGFHYGNMPLLVRMEIESLFRDNLLSFLVCTSTLMEGVNLPCKSVFLRGPKRGNMTPLNSADFWNLAGRAGRWGTEFQGNIICIDPKKPEVWKTEPPTSRERLIVKSTTDTTISSESGFIEYVKNGFQFNVGKINPEFDYVASFLVCAIVRGEQLVNSPALSGVSRDDREVLDTVLNAEFESFILPPSLVFRNPGVLPRAMVALDNYLSAIDDANFEQHIPCLPESDDASTRYQFVFDIINQYLRANWSTGAGTDDKRLWQMAYLAVDWMNGKPLSVLIRKREHFAKVAAEKKGTAPPSTASIIRNTMADVEEYARFKIPRFLRCYNDIIILQAEKRSLEHLVKDLPDLELWLELGVSGKTTLALMEVGLSRTSAIELFEAAMLNTEMKKDEVIKWLRETNLEGFSLPVLVMDEIRKAILRLVVR